MSNPTRYGPQEPTTTTYQFHLTGTDYQGRSRQVRVPIRCHSRAHAEALCKYLVDGLRWHSAGCIDAEAEAHIEQLCDANPHA